MGDQTAIGWTNKTYNPWMGCHKVSPGCAHCYMFTEQRRYGNDPNVVRRSKTTFRAPLKWTEPALVFTCSWSDFFIEEADEWRPEVWEIIRQTPHLTYQVLTKRPENIAARLPEGWPFRNVWLGVSAESQRFLEQRMYPLLEVPAAVHFISAEPLLGPLDLLDGLGLVEMDMMRPHDFKATDIGLGYPEGHDLFGHPYCQTCGNTAHDPFERGFIDWVIAGGESGPNHRPMNLDWARSIRDQCVSVGVPFFFKQDSGPMSGRQGRAEDGLWRYKEIPDFGG